ncbi:MAG: 4Fe-4S dicluster domain-containing protein [Nitrospirae bacterium]|jgi:sulfhydrogenase subunit beta (sulfur reductase)|nr:4Fe-4S dicluster domain-containing protein [Nitrospirota bacterium]
MQYAILRKERFNDFIARLSEIQKLVAPVSKGYNNFAFEEVTTGDEIALKYIPTILPAKKFFLPRRETLLEFNDAKGANAEASVEYEPVTLFGLHTCDLSGIQCLNMVFSERPKDYNYITRKNKIILIGLECNEYCDEYASCHLVNASFPSGGYDLFFTDLGDYYVVHVNTPAGDEIIDKTESFEKAEVYQMNELKNLRDHKRKIFINEVPIDRSRIPELFDLSFSARVWKELEERCLACGNCTNVCPTCYCFDIIDEIGLNMKQGVRYRVWDSCQLEPFAKVAGGINFRKERSARQRHRYYRKFSYPVERFSRFFCTGCGRCTRTCMAGISLKETLNELIKESEDRVWRRWL